MHLLSKLTILTFVAASTACSPSVVKGPLHPTLLASRMPALISAADFFADQKQSSHYRLSPDGKKLAWIARKGDKPTIHFKVLASESIHTINTEKPVYRVWWARDSRRLSFYWDNDGDENYHLYIADTENPEAPPKDMTPFVGARVWWHQSFRDDPAHLLIKLNKRDRSLYDLYRLNIRSGQLTLIAENPGDVINWVTDKAGTIIARYRRLEDGGWVMELPVVKDGAWKTLISGNADEDFASKGHSPGGTFLWGLSNRGRDKSALVRLDLRTGEEEVVYAHAEVDVDNAWVDENTYELVNAWAWPGYISIHYFDKSLGRDLALFQADGPANIRVQSYDNSRMRLTVQVEREVSGTSYYLLDRHTKTKTLLSKASIARHRDKLSRSRPVSFSARDGLRLHGYLTIPRGTTGKLLPMVLRVHGGPWGRDYWGYHVVDQFLANRGYAVLSVNYRGSTGYGRAFIKASRRQFAHKMHDDLIDGVNWAIRQGLADPKKIAIFGRSYGGYATMVGLTFTPEVFAAGVNVVGVADLVRTAETFPAYWKQWMHRWLDYVGDPKKPKDRADMAARSPINFIDRIQRPLLMAQGANDVRVVREHSDRIAAAMQKAGKDFEYIVFEDEGHAIRKWQNQLTFARKMEKFLAKHLGGRAGKGD